MSPSFLRRALRSAVVLSLFGAGICIVAIAQDSCPCPPSASASPSGQQSALAAAAQNAKNQKARKAKKIFTDEDMALRQGPFAKLNLDGPDNGDSILESMIEYKKGHSAEETESAIRTWYEEYDTILQAAIEESKQLRTLRNANTSNGYELCQEGGDYDKCEKRRRSEVRGAMYDQNKIQENGITIGRIQQTLMRIRNGLSVQGGSYPWFKVRNANGIGNF